MLDILHGYLLFARCTVPLAARMWIAVRCMGTVEVPSNAKICTAVRCVRYLLLRGYVKALRNVSNQIHHGLSNYKDAKTKCRHLKNYL